MVNQARVLEEFVRLVKIDSLTGEERQIADYLKRKLTELGLTVWEDTAAERLGTETGNLIARLPGNIDIPTIFWGAHMDTVPGRGIEPVVRGEAVYSSGETILGADDKAGIAAILEAIQILKEEKINHGPIEVLLTVGEEEGLRGAKALDLNLLLAQFGFVLDSNGEIGSLVVQGPCQNLVEATIAGRAAHAGINPQDGINAIQVAAKAISAMRLGRIDDATTANIGVIQGGEARNIVPDKVYLKGETRSLKRERLEEETRQMQFCLENTAREMGATVKVEIELLYPEFCLSENEVVVQIAQDAVQRLGRQPSMDKSGGGSDANILNARGLRTINLGIAMRKVHTSEEHIFLRDLNLLPLFLVEISQAAVSVLGKV
ncbi:MAG: M20/M25/M40 family metallo-hydrolase [Syntrophomonadaceae bacterium]|nr:M20/M25/M40 family metallo-hydrolase [Syntrophomonadaceae bacterium]